MKRWLWTLVVLAVAVGASRGQGPGDGGATLKFPGLEPTRPTYPNPGAGKPAPVPEFLQGKLYPEKKSAQPAADPIDMNRDIEITPQAGQWVIFVMSYSGPKAPSMAREFVDVLRRDYKLNAYVYNYGAKEKQAEIERVRKIRQEQADKLHQAGLKDHTPIYVPMMKIDEQTGVLIGGYRSFDEASNAVKNTIRKLDPEPLKDKVHLDMWFVSQTKFDKETKKAEKVEGVKETLGLVNPFKRAFPARNPSLPKEDAPPTTEEDLKFLRHVNRDESLTLLQCKKQWTLAIKQFNTGAKAVASAQEAKGFLEKFHTGFMSLSKDGEDMAAHAAHNLADGLRKSGLQEAYVLHGRNCSFVTVGGFDSLEDPRLVAMQNWLETYLKHDAFRPFDMFPRPVPMPVPGVGVMKSSS